MRLILCFLGLLVLAACSGGAGKGVGPLPLDVQATASYRHDEQPMLTLITVINNRSGAGAHTALMVNGSQRVIFDPAGSVRADWVTEFGDVLYGITPRKYQAYKSSHAREEFHVVTQDIPVSATTAERALQLVQAQGTVSSAFCANSTSGILRQLPGFENVKVTFFPKNLMEQIESRPGVTTDRYYENDAGDVIDGVASAGAQLEQSE